MLSCSIRSVLAVWKLLRSDTLTISGMHTWNLRWNYWNFFFSTQKKLQSKYLWGQIINFERKYLTLLYTDVSTWVNQIVNNVLAPTHSAKVRKGAYNLSMMTQYYQNIVWNASRSNSLVSQTSYNSQVFLKSWTLNITDVKKRKWLDFLDFRFKNF